MSPEIFHVRPQQEHFIRATFQNTSFASRLEHFIRAGGGTFFKNPPFAFPFCFAFRRRGCSHRERRNRSRTSNCRHHGWVVRLSGASWDVPTAPSRCRDAFWRFRVSTRRAFGRLDRLTRREETSRFTATTDRRVLGGWRERERGGAEGREGGRPRRRHGPGAAKPLPPAPATKFVISPLRPARYDQSLRRGGRARADRDHETASGREGWRERETGRGDAGVSYPPRFRKLVRRSSRLHLDSGSRYIGHSTSIPEVDI